MKMEFYLDIYDSNILIDSSKYKSNLNVEDIFNFFHSSEGILVESIESKGEETLLRYINYNNNGKEILDNFLSKYHLEKIENRDQIPSQENDSEFVIAIGCIDSYSADEIEKLTDLIRKELIDKEANVTKRHFVGEFGASVDLHDIIIDFSNGVAAAYAVMCLEKIRLKIKQNKVNYSVIKLFNLTIIKKQLKDDYDVQINTLKIKSAYNKNKDEVELTLYSRYKEYVIIVDKKSNVIEFEEKKLTQTEI